MEFFVFILIVGLATYWLFRHPIKTLKFTGAFVGLLLLGLAMVVVFISVTVMVLA